VKPVDVIQMAARSGILLSYGIVTEAFAGVDRAPLEEKERARYEAKVWDGTGAPAVGEPERWLHGNDGNSQAAIEALQSGQVVYFLMRDGSLLYWQPYRGDMGGHIRMVNDPEHDDHWEKAAEGHIAQVISGDVDQQVYEATLEKALALHEERGVPYHLAPTATRP